MNSFTSFIGVWETENRVLVFNFLLFCDVVVLQPGSVVSQNAQTSASWGSSWGHLQASRWWVGPQFGKIPPCVLVGATCSGCPHVSNLSEWAHFIRLWGGLSAGCRNRFSRLRSNSRKSHWKIAWEPLFPQPHALPPRVRPRWLRWLPLVAAQLSRWLAHQIGLWAAREQIFE